MPRTDARPSPAAICIVCEHGQTALWHRWRLQYCHICLSQPTRWPSHPSAQPILQFAEPSPSRIINAITIRPASRLPLSPSYLGIQNAPYHSLVITKPNSSPSSPIQTPHTQQADNQENREAHDTCGAKPAPYSPILPRSLATRETLPASAALWRDVLSACLWQLCAAMGKTSCGSNDVSPSQLCLRAIDRSSDDVSVARERMLSHAIHRGRRDNLDIANCSKEHGKRHLRIRSIDDALKGKTRMKTELISTLQVM